MSNNWTWTFVYNKKEVTLGWPKPANIEVFKTSSNDTKVSLGTSVPNLHKALMLVGEAFISGDIVDTSSMAEEIVYTDKGKQKKVPWNHITVPVLAPMFKAIN